MSDKTLKVIDINLLAEVILANQGGNSQKFLKVWDRGRYLWYLKRGDNFELIENQDSEAITQAIRVFQLERKLEYHELGND